MTRTRHLAGRRSESIPLATTPLAVIAVLAVTGIAVADPARIGIYEDPVGIDCNLATLLGVPTTYYVVVTPPTGGGFTGVEFSAPLPDCFQGLFLSEYTPLGMIALGDSQSGIDIASPTCLEEPTVVLTMTVFANAPPDCCAFPILERPDLSTTPQYADCDRVLHEADGLVSVLGGNESCPCGDPDSGTIRIRTVSIPAGRTGFRFAQDIDTSGVFVLDDGGVREFLDVPAGAYAVSEYDPLVQPGSITLRDIVCHDSNSSGLDSVVDIGMRTATVHLDSYETVTCSFINGADCNTNGIDDALEIAAEFESSSPLIFISTPTGVVYDAIDGPPPAQEPGTVQFDVTAFNAPPGTAIVQVNGTSLGAGSFTYPICGTQQATITAPASEFNTALAAGGGDAAVQVTIAGTTTCTPPSYAQVVTSYAVNRKPDCNTNGVIDECDVTAGASRDCNVNGVPDECEVSGAQTGKGGVLVRQPPANFSSPYSDADCDACPDEAQVVAEQFILTRSQTISALRIWGVYDPDNSPGAHDDMTVLFHEDGAGLPGAVIASAFDVPTVRTDTGVDEYGLDVYVLTLTLSRPVSLGAGTYLVEVYNNTEDNSDSFVWESGDLDPDYGVPGIAFARQAPGVDWFFLGGDANMSLEIVARATDCNTNGIPDECDIAAGTSGDCNQNDQSDVCDLVWGSSRDCNANRTPDECESDCNANEIADECDIAGGTSFDCQADSIPDECDIVAGTSFDCQQDGIPDECQLAGRDCNDNAVPDECDISYGSSFDCNINGRPDECDLVLLPGEISLLILGADDVAEFPVSELAFSGNFAVVDGTDVTNAVPESITLGGYDAVLVFTNNSPASPALLGDRLADYVDFGGRLAIATYAYSDPLAIAGRVTTPGYAPLVNSGVKGSVGPTLIPTVPDDPIFNGINVGGVSYFKNSFFAHADLDAGATLLAKDASDVNMIARNAAGNAYGLNLHPAKHASNNAEFYRLLARILTFPGTGSSDCQGDGIPDECQVLEFDCNLNAIPDDCDIAAATSADCLPDGIPDECQPDCNTNGEGDDCDIAFGLSFDCQPDGVPDECQLGPGWDCNLTGVPDDCESFGPGDFDGDYDVDLVDFAFLAEAMTGPSANIIDKFPDCWFIYFMVFDSNLDLQLDLRDFAEFQRLFRRLIGTFAQIGGPVMKRMLLLLAIPLVPLPIVAIAEEPVGAAFTYQGQLRQNGTPVSGLADFVFTLWDAPTNGIQAGVAVSSAPGGHPVVDGLFTIELDFNPPDEWIYFNAAYWLEVQVAFPAGSGNWETLTPRQRLTATPYASSGLVCKQRNWDGLINMPAGFADGVDDVGTNTFWALTGNAGTEAATNFLGTTDDVPLELRVNNTRAMLIDSDQVLIIATNGVGINTNGPSAGLHVESEDIALRAESKAATGETCGAYITVNSPEGYGLCAVNTSFGNEDTPAVYGEHLGADWFGIGVEGLGGAAGVYGAVIPTGTWYYDGVVGMVYGGNGTNSGVSGWANEGEQNFGVSGQAFGANENYGVYGFAADGDVNYGGYFVGDLFASGQITREYNSVESRAAPLAYGYVHWHGGLNDATANVVGSMFNTTGTQYEIEITDADFSGAQYYDYVVNITVQGNVAAFGTWSGSEDGKLHVHIWNHAGGRIMSSFCFVVYKPVIDSQVARNATRPEALRESLKNPSLRRPRFAKPPPSDPVSDLTARIERLESLLGARTAAGKEAER